MTESSVQGHRASAIWNIAGDMQTADIIPRAAGDFKMQCRTAEHVQAGMIAHLHVESDGKFFCIAGPYCSMNKSKRLECLAGDQAHPCILKSCMRLLWFDGPDSLLGGAGSDPLDSFNGTERKTYISADIEEHNYVPDENNACTGEAFDEDTVSCHCIMQTPCAVCSKPTYPH